MRASRAMSAEFCDIIKQGYVKFKGKTVGTWNRRWIILRRASSKGPQRIEKFHDEHDSLGHVGCLEKAILLTSVRSIERPGGDVKKHAVTLCLADGHARTFACSSEYEAEEWVRMLGMVAEMDLISSSSPSSSSPSSATAQLDLLDSVPDHKLQTDQFYVYLCPNPALQEYGECVMNVTSEDVFLTDIGDVATVIVTWPLNSLRRYGRDGSKFTFESGRRCTTGEGLFVFNTVEGEKIYAKVHNATIAISQATAMIRRQQLAASTSNPLSSSTLPRSASSPASPVSPGCATLPRSPDLAPGYTACPTLSDTPSLSHSHSLPAQLSSPGPAPPPRSALDRPLPPVPRQKRSDPDPAGEYDHIVAGVTVKGGSRKAPPAMPPRRTPSTRSIKDTPLPPTPELNNNDEKSPRLSSVGEKPGKSGKGKHGNGNHSNDYSSTGNHGDQAATAAASGGDGSSSSDAGVPRMTGDYDLDYIYEEKGLEPQFRKFLQKRKDGEEGDDKGGGL